MRGILGALEDTCDLTRITPAHAGNTGWFRIARSPGGDHPRACGEYIYDAATGKVYQGSPPRMRGIRRLLECRNRHLGITPAHAGNTLKNPMI